MAMYDEKRENSTDPQIQNKANRGWFSAPIIVRKKRQILVAMLGVCTSFTFSTDASPDPLEIPHHSCIFALLPPLYHPARSASRIVGKP
jgi:hypothetical protein